MASPNPDTHQADLNKLLYKVDLQTADLQQIATKIKNLSDLTDSANAFTSDLQDDINILKHKMAKSSDSGYGTLDSCQKAIDRVECSIHLKILGDLEQAHIESIRNVTDCLKNFLDKAAGRIDRKEKENLIDSIRILKSIDAQYSQSTDNEVALLKQAKAKLISTLSEIETRQLTNIDRWSKYSTQLQNTVTQWNAKTAESTAIHPTLIEKLALNQIKFRDGIIDLFRKYSAETEDTLQKHSMGIEKTQAKLNNMAEASTNNINDIHRDLTGMLAKLEEHKTSLGAFVLNNPDQTIALVQYEDRTEGKGDDVLTKCENTLDILNGLIQSRIIGIQGKELPIVLDTVMRKLQNVGIATDFNPIGNITRDLKGAIDLVANSEDSDLAHILDLRDLLNSAYAALCATHKENGKRDKLVIDGPSSMALEWDLATEDIPNLDTIAKTMGEARECIHSLKRDAIELLAAHGGEQQAMRVEYERKQSRLENCYENYKKNAPLRLPNRL